MNPSSNESPGINLPPPIAEQSPMQAPQFEQPAAPERALSNPEQAPPIAPATPMLQATPQPIAPQTASLPQQGVVSSTTQSVVAAVVDDGDLIEKEWVEKAKKIVESNRDDPHKQSEELTAFRADYLQQHYNKTIKTS